MSRYTVVWHQDAHDQLANIWLDAADREPVALAANAIDRHLAADAMGKGVEVEGELRQLMVPPLRVLFAASEADRIVRIVHVAAV